MYLSKINFKVEWNMFEYSVFFLIRLDAVPKLKNPVCPTIYQLSRE